MKLVEDGEPGEFGGDGGVFDEADTFGEEVIPGFVGIWAGFVGESAVVDPGGFDGADGLEEFFNCLGSVRIAAAGVEACGTGEGQGR